MSEQFTFFWSGPLSQWSPSPFFMYDEMGNQSGYFSCAEQYMMWSKAALFGDIQRADLILKTDDPSKQKAHGRQVRNFDPVKWDSVCKHIVFRGNVAKFEQNMVHLAALRNTVGTTLVEASPYDTIWGIGLTADDPRAQSRDTWLGKNYLGEVLTNVRIKLIGR